MGSILRDELSIVCSVVPLSCRILKELTWSVASSATADARHSTINNSSITMYIV